jgi:hypothetical protein
MGFRIGVDGDVALVQVRHHRHVFRVLAHRARDDLLARRLLVDHRLLGNEDGDRRALRIVVLAGDVEDVGADDVGHVSEDLGQALGVVGLVDVLDVALALLLGDGVADVIDVETERLGEVVEPLELEARKWLDHGDPLDGRIRTRVENTAPEPGGRPRGARAGRRLSGKAAAD